MTQQQQQECPGGIRIYGLTGGTGSGKSAAAERFAARGIPCIDADRMGHEALREPETLQAIVDAFGTEVLDAEGQVDRELLGPVVFADAGKRCTLNAIVHPRIVARIASEVARLAGEEYRTVIVDAALLAEGGRKDPWLAGLILVLSDDRLRIERLARLRGIPEEEAVRRIEAQTRPETKAPFADWIIHNDGTLEELYKQVDAIADDIAGHGEAEFQAKQSFGRSKASGEAELRGTSAFPNESLGTSNETESGNE